ncbi:hypothetical protein GALMADRAFT_1233885 [Galerina marginata CBS 339.88]|uniref:Uncharacterized protein n=1 Tax=Galerina marginata (strain CBS 339.88) TaxID=685588 RepID=A0A067THD8_GALM3|nr:hypothetical protein GALMADRAFT_1233885 [Galerina marginata CBS 339.88]
MACSKIDKDFKWRFYDESKSLLLPLGHFYYRIYFVVLASQIPSKWVSVTAFRKEPAATHGSSSFFIRIA